MSEESPTPLPSPAEANREDRFSMNYVANTMKAFSESVVCVSGTFGISHSELYEAIDDYIKKGDCSSLIWKYILRDGRVCSLPTNELKS